MTPEQQLDNDCRLCVDKNCGIYGCLLTESRRLNRGLQITPTKFSAALDKLGLTRLTAAEWLDVDEKTIRRWRDGEQPIPKSIEMLLRYALIHGL